MELCRVLLILRQIAELIAVSEVKLLKTAASHNTVDTPAEIIIVWLAVLLPKSFCPYRRIIVIDPPLYTLSGVIVPELMDADRLPAAGRCDRPVLPLRIETVVVAALAELIFEFFYVKTERNCLVYSLACYVVPRRHPGFFHFIDILVHTFAFGVFNNRQAAFETYAVGCFLKLSVSVFAVMEFQSVPE